MRNDDEGTGDNPTPPEPGKARAGTRGATTADAQIHHSGGTIENRAASRLAEDRVSFLNRILKTLSETNEMMVREDDLQAVWDGVCRILVEQGGLRMAWIAVADPESFRLKPVACAGIAMTALEAIEVRWDDTPEGNGSMGPAVRTRQHSVHQDLLSEPCFAPWNDFMAAHQFRSVAAFPLVVRGLAKGALAVYSDRIGAFLPEVVSLLDRLAANVAYAQEVNEDRAERQKAETAFREAQGRLTALVNAAPLAIVSMDAEGKVEAWNRQAEKLFGWSEAEVIGRLPPYFPDGEEDTVLDRRLGDAEEITSILGEEITRKHRDGRLLDLRISTAPLRDEEGRFDGVMAVFEDIAEWKRSQEALKESERKYRELFKNNLAGVFQTAPDGRVLDCNDAFARLFGLDSREDLQGRLAQEFYPNPALREQYVRRLQEQGRLQNFEYLRKRDDGSPLWTLENVSLVRDPDGKPVRLEGTIIDITERKLAETALKEREQQLSLIYKTVKEVLFYLAVESDGHFRFLSVNDAFLKATGLGEEQVAGKLVQEVIPQPSLDMVLEKYREAIREGHSVAWEEVSDYPAGTKHGEVSVTPVLDEHGRCTHLVGTVHDITERKQAEQVLRTRLELMELATTRGPQAVLQKTLDRICELEDSPIGSFHFIEDDGMVLSFQAGTTRTVTEVCTTEGAGMHYPADLSRAWADAFHTKQPVVRNNFASLSGKKGMSEGNADLVRELVVPIVRAGTVVSIIGIANKPFDYTDHDVERVSYLAEVGWEIATLKRAEEALARSEERYRLFFDKSFEAVYVLDVKSKRVVEANPSFCTLLGYTSEEAKRLTLYDVVAHPPEQVNAFIHKVLASGTHFIGERSWKRKDGTQALVEVSASVVKQEHGIYLFVVGKDVTEFKEAAQERDFLFTAIEQAQEGIIVTSTAGTILYANGAMADLTGYAKAELLGKNPRLLKSGKQEPSLYEDLWKTILAGSVWTGKVINKKKNGDLYTAQLTISPVRDPKGAMTAFVAAQRDVTREVEMERRLEQAKILESMGMLTDGVAHEVRNPLFAISTVVAALEQKVGDQAELAEYMAHIKNQSKHLNDLMKDLLALGRPVKKEQFKQCLMEDVVKRSVKLLDGSRPGTSERCVLNMPEAPLFVRAVPEKLAQVFINLLDNAFAFSPAEGMVRITIHPEGADVALTITDSGPGIPEDMLPTIFEPFQSRRKGGTGLGLAIVRHIVSAHGGSVEAANNDPGPGAVFTVRLPLSP